MPEEDEKICEHSYKHLETIKRSKSQGHDDITYTRIDLFYCTKCLAIEERIKHQYQLSYKEAPVWW